MTADEQIEKLDDRVTRLEHQSREDIVAIHQKLDTLTNKINESLVSQAKRDCPAPGSCLVLSEQLKAAVTAHNSTMLRVERLELRMMKQENGSSKMFGGLAVLVVVVNVAVPIILHFFGIK